MTLRTSNPERLDINPKSKTMAPYGELIFEVKLKLIKKFPKKGQNIAPIKDQIYIKSNFFDIKVNVLILPESLSNRRLDSISKSLSPTEPRSAKEPLIKTLSSNLGLLERDKVKEVNNKEKNENQAKLEIVKEFKEQENKIKDLESELEIVKNQLIKQDDCQKKIGRASCRERV